MFNLGMKIIRTVLMLIFIISCKNDDLETMKFTESNLLTLELEYLGTTYKTIIDGQTISLSDSFPHNTQEVSVKFIEVSPLATTDINIGDKLMVNQSPITISVTAKDNNSVTEYNLILSKVELEETTDITAVNAILNLNGKLYILGVNGDIIETDTKEDNRDKVAFYDRNGLNVWKEFEGNLIARPFISNDAYYKEFRDNGDVWTLREAIVRFTPTIGGGGFTFYAIDSMRIEYLYNKVTMGNITQGIANRTQVSIDVSNMLETPTANRDYFDIVPFYQDFKDDYTRLTGEVLPLDNRHLSVYHIAYEIRGIVGFTTSASDCDRASDAPIDIFMNTKIFIDNVYYDRVSQGRRDYLTEIYKRTFYHELSHDILNLAHPYNGGRDDDGNYNDPTNPWILPNLMSSGSEDIERYASEPAYRNEVLSRTWVEHKEDHPRICRDRN